MDDPSHNAAGDWLVFFETSGNQAYIFGTNRLRENVGASELTYKAGTAWILEAAGFGDMDATTPSTLRKQLSDNPVRGDVEVILATSGKALLLVANDPGGDRARGIVRRVTEKVAADAPGMSISGAVAPLASRDSPSFSTAYRAVHERFFNNREAVPNPSPRFAMLPFCERCVSSGLPAESLSGRNGGPVSSVTKKKLDAADAWFKRASKVLEQRHLMLSRGIDELEKDFEQMEWLGVVYADGSGLGQIMMNFERWIGDADYRQALRAFSLALDEATEAAFLDACGELSRIRDLARNTTAGKLKLPIVPLLLGGDDLTVLVHGKYALPFARKFLEAFERQTSSLPALAGVAAEALSVGRLAANAGVAIVKPHFPFHSAHGLAASLLASAKQVKKHVRSKGGDSPMPCSSLDFHILFDAAYSGLDMIRGKRRTGPDGEKLWGGPYVTIPLADLAGADGADWAARHHVDRLVERVDALNARSGDSDSLKLPASQMHALRESLAEGKAAVDAHLTELSRFNGLGLRLFFEQPPDQRPSLFTSAGEGGTTTFLDALTSAEFWPGVDVVTYPVSGGSAP